MEKMAQGSKEGVENSGFSWWLLLAGVAGFALLSLLGAAALVIILSYA